MVNRKYRLYRKGFSLAEALLAAALLSIATAGVVLPFTGGASVQAEGIHRTVASGLADDLMQRISNTDFDTVVATYNGYSEAQGQIKDTSGVVIDDAGYSYFSRSVSCEYVYLSQQAGNGDESFALITVGVDYKGDRMVTLTKLMAK